MIGDTCLCVGGDVLDVTYGDVPCVIDGDVLGVTDEVKFTDLDTGDMLFTVDGVGTVG